MFWGTVRCGKLLAILDFQVVQGAGENAVGGGCRWHSRGPRFAAKLVLCNARKTHGIFVRITLRGAPP